MYIILSIHSTCVSRNPDNLTVKFTIVIPEKRLNYFVQLIVAKFLHNKATSYKER